MEQKCVGGAGRVGSGGLFPLWRRVEVRPRTELPYSGTFKERSRRVNDGVNGAAAPFPHCPVV